MSLKALPIILGVIALALLGAVIFIPANKDQNPAPPGQNGQNGAVNNPSGSSTVPDGNEDNSGTPSPILYGYTSTKGKTVNAYLAANQQVQSPLRLTGNVPGGWAFEASFPVKIVDANGKTIWQGPAAVPNWMNAGQNWFGVTMTFTKPTTATGFIVLQNDNASGLPENADEVRIPVKF